MRAPPALRSTAAVLSASSRRLGRAYRSVVVAGRWFVVAAWVLGAALTTALVPGGGAGGGSFANLLPPDSPAVKVAERSLREFDVPLLSRTTVVLHDPGGLSVLTRADAVLWALSQTQRYLAGDVPQGSGQVVAAVPVPTAADDTFVTYLYVSSGTGPHTTTRLAHQYAAHFSHQASVRTYVTGFIPAQVAQGDYLQQRLPLFEGASVLLIALVVALVFRSPVAPLAVLGVAALGYLVYFRLLGSLAAALGFEVPGQLEPLLVALLLGVVTDYCVLFFSTFRDALATGVHRHEAARRAVRQDGPIIAVAGLTVTGGTISLLAGTFDLFRGLGPALALTVVVGLAVSLTMIPAVMAILGHRLFARQQHSGSPAHPSRPGSAFTHRLVGRLTLPRGAVVAAAASIALLVLAAVPLGSARLSLSFTTALPADDPVARGAQVLQAAGVRGIAAPTEVLVEGDGVTGQRAALGRLQAAISGQPGVAQVLGPAQNPFSDAYGIVLSDSGDAARFVVVVDSDPLAARAVDTVRSLQDRLPELARSAGLRDADVAVTGQTVISSEVAFLTRRSLVVTFLTALAVELVILVLYLRALVAPVALLACSALGVAASLGLTALVFQGVLGEPGLTFYVPFATAVLLLALGSDYNVFTVGSIWEEAARRPLAEALAVAVPRSARAITAAGFILAATFALVAIIRLSTFRQIAFAMSAGLLIDTLLVRPVLTPAVLTLLGRSGSWPSRRITVAARPRTGTPTASTGVPAGHGGPGAGDG